MKYRIAPWSADSSERTSIPAVSSLSEFRNYLYCKGNRSFHLLAGLCSIVLGQLFAAKVLYSLPMDYSSLKRADELGIFSQTILEGYPKALEIRYYVLGVTISIISGLAVFFGVSYLHYRRMREQAGNQQNFLIQGIEQPKPRMKFWHWAVLLSTLFLLTFHFDFIYKNWYWAEWGFLFEEGIYLRWINDLLRGRILYRDIYFYCGPFMIWPQYWLMKLFGASIVIHRYYIYFCYFIGYLIVFKVLRATIRNRVLILVGMALILFFYYPMFPGVHQSLARYSISLLPLYFLYRSFFQRQSLYLFISGVFLGFALLFSQELGLSSLVASGAMMLVFTYREGIRARTILRQVAFSAIGMLLFLFPVFAYFFVHHSLVDFLDTMVYSPKTYAVGAFAVKFPIFFDIFKKGAEYGPVEILLAYWPPVFYVCSIFFFLVLFFGKVFSNRHIFFFGIAALGSLMFQRGFGVYAPITIKNLLYPVIILTIGYLDMIWQRTAQLRRERTAIRKHKVEFALFAALFLLNGWGFVAYGMPGRGFSPSLEPFRYRLGLQAHYGRFVCTDMPRAHNIYMPVEWGGEIMRAVEYIRTKTQPDEPIYVFPYAPVIYFLADRLSPVKYPAVYTITRETRQLVAQELKNKVKYVVFVKRPEPFLGLSPEQRFPEIVDCINEIYEPEKEFSHILILKKKIAF